MSNFPECPVSLKGIAHYLKTAVEHDARDLVVAYYCRLYALQLGLKLSSQQPDETQMLMALMDWLEATKKSSDNESITHEVAGQAYLENYALKLFTYADKQDREANFGKNVVKAFYTAGILYDVMMNFGELTDEVQQNRKYAKWKAAYIHKCLKEGQTPIAGPMPTEGDEEEGQGEEGGAAGGGSDQPIPSSSSQPSPPPVGPQMGFSSGFDLPPPPVGGFSAAPSGPPVDINKLPTPPSEPTKPIGGFKPYVNPGHGAPVDTYEIPAMASSGNVTLNLEQTTQAQKYCKFASNSLNFGDLNAAVQNLHKALRLIQTGQDG